MTRILLIVTIVCLSACTDTRIGRPIDAREVPLIEPGHSDKQYIRDQFGQPLRIVQKGSAEIWVYRHMDGKGQHSDLIVAFNGEGKVVTASAE